MSRSGSQASPSAVMIAPFVMGAALALAGGYWDDAWHTERGRDSFFIAPHIAIYGGVSLAGGALALWALLAIRERGVADALRYPPLALALLSVVVTLASAPIDNAWHLAFGRDAVIWSPPHVLGILGTGAMTASVLVELVRNPSPWARRLEPVVGALMLSAFSFLVVEYETDVPQFSPLWYLPVLAAGSSFVVAVVRLTTADRFAATKTTAIHLGFVVLVSGFLAVSGFDTPKLPLLLVPALALDALANRGASRWAQALAFTGLVYAAYVPTVDLLGEGLRLDGSDVLRGAPLAAVGVFVVLSALGGHTAVRRPRRAVATAALTLLLLASVAAPASAHDPGQGEDAGRFDLVAVASGKEISVVATPHLTATAQPRLLVARRAGKVRRAPLRRRGSTLIGTVSVPDDGRWFVYVTVRSQGRPVESWLPVKVGVAEKRVVETARFAYFSDREPSGTVKWVSGALMYALMVAFLAAVVRLVRRTAAVTLPREQEPA